MKSMAMRGFVFFYGTDYFVRFV